MKSVAIIGGGITGLTAAHRLRGKGIPVTVYEAGDRAGGVIRSVRQGGFLAECGPNSILETSPKITSLVKEAGLENRRLAADPQARNRYIVRGGKPVALPGSFGGFMRTPLFSLGAKLRLFAEPFIRRSPADAEESLADFVLRRLGPEFLDYAINPFVAGVYAGDPAHLSVQQAFPKLHALEQKYGSLIVGQFLGARERKRRAEVSKQNAKPFSFDDGLQVLVDTLAGNLGDDVRLGWPVSRIQPAPSGWWVSARRRGDLQTGEHSAIIFAGTVEGLTRLEVVDDRIPNFRPLEKVYHPPVASVVLGFRREDVAHPLDGFGVLVPRVENCDILGALFSSSLFPGRAPAGHVTLTNYVGGARNPGLALLPLDEQEELVLRDLRKLLGVTGRPVFRHQCLYRRAIPQYDIGFGKLRALMAEAELAAPGFFLAGHYRDGISLGDSIVSGHDAAERVEAHLRGQPARAGSHEFSTSVTA